MYQHLREPITTLFCGNSWVYIPPIANSDDVAYGDVAADLVVSHRTAGPGRQKSKEKTWWCRKQELSQRFDGEYYKYYKYYPAKKA